MTRRRRLWIGAAAAAVVALVVFHRREPPTERFEPFTVQRGALRSLLRESGELAPHDPVLIKAPFQGRISMIVEDGVWVEKGETLVVLGEDDEVKRLSDDRGSLVGARQELRLARLRRAHAEETEGVKLTAAQRALALEQVRWRILSSTPAGGMELARLSDELAPIEADTERVRDAWETAQQAYQKALDRYLAALDAEQDHRDEVLRAQSRVDELAAVAEADPEGMQAPERAERDKAGADLAPARADLEKLRQDTAGLSRKLTDARAARDAAQLPRDQAARALGAAEERERDLRVRIEIEKRGVQAAELELDRRAAELALAEAVRKRDQGLGAFKSGALSQSALDDLETQVATLTNQLEIARQKLAIASRPPPPETLEEGKAKLARAKEVADRAQAAHDRALAIQDQEIAVLEAKVARLEHSIEARSARFPALLEDDIRFDEKELAALDPEEDKQRRAEIGQELEKLRAQLVEAKASPPNVLTAPVSGICRVRKDNDRPRQAGDKLYEEDVVIDLFPPENMEVVARVNEATVARIAAGMPAEVEIGSLPGPPRRGSVTQVAGVGKDKNPGGNAASGVTQFEVRVRLDATSQDFRQGMSALVTVELARKADATWLPLGAVTKAADGWSVLAGSARSPSPKAVQGEPFGQDAFVISGGLQAGDVVYARRVIDQ
jgi:multidrug resistance efflux pump